MSNVDLVSSTEKRKIVCLDLGVTEGGHFSFSKEMILVATIALYVFLSTTELTLASRYRRLASREAINE